MKDVNDVSPSSLKHIIGQRNVVRSVEVALDYAFNEGVAFPSAMLLGPPGTGKSATAHVIQSEMAVSKFQEVLGQTVTNTADVNALLLAAKDKSVVHIDEVHELSPHLQTTLYLALDKKTVYVGGNGRAPQAIPIADFTLLISTTDEFKILQPLRDRMRLALRFEHLGNDELCQVIFQRSKALGWDVHEAALPLIAQRSKGTPRLALRLLQSCRRVAVAKGFKTIDSRHLAAACELDGIDELGLDAAEQRYLEILSEGPTRLNVIASRLGLPTRTVSEVTESFLIRAELIGKDKNGMRELMPKGRDHVLASRKDTV
ncbi:Holliday junction DNA helicase RuvB C-terminal domain-containing protein [Bremerella sp. P1]|uniref:Holliday junction DNA helicase RuvB C-terminal domain-containing protein n=1 Tax=Bremerella sp. P1 TaxID=3026424 RepID=UPI002368C691|nr:Holliday junction DNA helicase RuvB C-terminal domain-containing protein [Bremerella sp. P1]WDI43712.1 Holliday junction DNA helicase RuvB C-terminal domain-containing protein [Bremerella sp. P1]